MPRKSSIFQGLKQSKFWIELKISRKVKHIHRKIKIKFKYSSSIKVSWWQQNCKK